MACYMLIIVYMSIQKTVTQPWKHGVEEVTNELGADISYGLGDSDVDERRSRYGRNELRQKKRKSALKILLEQFMSLIILLLAVAGVVSFLFGETIEGIAIVTVILLNTLIGFFTELKAIRSMEALRKLGKSVARVRRNGEVVELRSEELVPGDVVLLGEGDIVPADIRLSDASKIQVDESPLTGESYPVGKQTDPIAEDSEVTDRTNMLFKGTAITRGAGEGIVVNTGMSTEIGRIAEMTQSAEEESTPLEQRLNRLGRKLIWITLAIAVVTAVAGIIAGREIFLMIETGIALAVAAIPEGLPIVATIALARGMWIMARRHALINKLSAVETLGTTNLIGVDKTGTLTENEMSTQTIRYFPDPDPDSDTNGTGTSDVDGESGKVTVAFDCAGLDESDAENQEIPGAVAAILETVRLCNNVESTGGDPLEVALVRTAEAAGITGEELESRLPEIREVAFDSETKMMATIHAVDGDTSNEHFLYAVKGAPEAVLDACTRVEHGAPRLGDGRVFDPGDGRDLGDGKRTELLDTADELAGEGLRVLAVARKIEERSDVEAYQDLHFLGFTALLDPPREDVKPAIRRCFEAGIDVAMITGDHASTAMNIAGRIGLLGEDPPPAVVGREIEALSETEEGRMRLRDAVVFARVDPEQKLNIITARQAQDNIVAMTGDGVNDAPALKKADIGIAMGRRGTEVAREAADMVLRDDAFSSIVAAIKQGRVIFDNIRKFVMYLLSCNLSEIMIVGLASFFAIPLPLLPLQILFLNLVTDVFPALALGVGKGGDEVMHRKARDPGESVLLPSHWRTIIAYSIVITVCVFGSLIIGFVILGAPRDEAVTMSFLTLAFAQLWHIFNMRRRDSRMFVNEITTNRYVWLALILCIAILLGALYIGPVAAVLELVGPDPLQWAVIIGMSLAPLLVIQLGKKLSRRIERSS